MKLENVKMEDLGKAKKITIDKDDTTVVEGQVGVDIVRRAIEAPLRWIAINAGVEGGTPGCWLLVVSC